MKKLSLFLFMALIAGADETKSYNYIDGKALKIDVSRTGITNLVFDEEMLKPVKRAEQNLDLVFDGNHVQLSFMPKVKYQLIGDKKVEVDRTVEAQRNHFWLIAKSGKYYELLVTPTEGFGETINIHSAEIEKSRANVFETKDPRNTVIMAIAKSALRSETPEGYKLQEINELSAIEPKFKAYLKRRYVGNLYMAEVYEIESLIENFEADEYNFKTLPTKNKVFISLYDWEKPLRKGETTELVIVGYKQ